EIAARRLGVARLCLELLEVVAGAERLAGAAEQKHGDSGIGVGRRQGAIEILDQFLGHGVEPMRAVERDCADAVTHLGQHGRHATLPAAAARLSAALSTLPTASIGSCSRTMKRFGTLKLARRARHHAVSSASFRTVPDSGIRYAQPTSP